MLYHMRHHVNCQRVRRLRPAFSAPAFPIIAAAPACATGRRRRACHELVSLSVSWPRLDLCFFDCIIRSTTSLNHRLNNWDSFFLNNWRANERKDVLSKWTWRFLISTFLLAGTLHSCHAIMKKSSRDTQPENYIVRGCRFVLHGSYFETTWFGPNRLHNTCRLSSHTPQNIDNIVHESCEHLKYTPDRKSVV